MPAPEEDHNLPVENLGERLRMAQQKRADRERQSEHAAAQATVAFFADTAFSLIEEGMWVDYPATRTAEALEIPEDAVLMKIRDPGDGVKEEWLHAGEQITNPKQIRDEVANVPRVYVPEVAAGVSLGAISAATDAAGVNIGFYGIGMGFVEKYKGDPMYGSTMVNRLHTVSAEPQRHPELVEPTLAAVYLVSVSARD